MDGSRRLELLKPLPTTSEGRDFEIRSKILGVYDKGKPGTVVETEQLLVDKEEDAPYARSVSSKFFVGQGEWGGPRGPSVPKYLPPEGREKSPDISSQIQLSPEAAHLYRYGINKNQQILPSLTFRCRLNGDYNPLHATPEPGQKMGLGGTIVHGLLTWNVSALALLRAFGGGDPTNLKQFEARFAAPVAPGAKVDVNMWRIGNVEDGGFEEFRFETEVDGKVVLSNGRCFIRCV